MTTMTIAKRVASPLGRGVSRPRRDRPAVSSSPNAVAGSGWLFEAIAPAGQQSSDLLLRAVTERDSALGIHVGGVAELACATAIKLGVSQNDVEATVQTALLHDVGKFAIPDRILQKNGPLDDAEWAFVKQHTVIGQRIISAAPALANVARLVRSTHERYDGSGYPDGLAGDAIPLIARIVAVCDAYDAIVTRRAYRDSGSPSTAIAELRRCAGTQFDPVVVDALVSETAPVALHGISVIEIPERGPVCLDGAPDFAHRRHLPPAAPSRARRQSFVG
jgi:HD-GYP domain-containing protein (c-di-GMP phosphodiesterase class II)